MCSYPFSQTRSPHVSAKRLSKTMPTVRLICWQAMALTSASKTLGKHGGRMPRKRRANGPSLRLTGSKSVEPTQIDLQTEHVVQK